MPVRNVTQVVAAPVQPATLAVGVFTVALIVGLPRLNHRLPATLIGLLAGTGAYACCTPWCRRRRSDR